MREKIFVDTVAWLALVNKRDKWHIKAKEIRQELIKQNCTFWVSEYILVEIANAFSKIDSRQSGVNLIESILKSSEMKLIWINQNLFDESWNLYKDRIDKEWSLTDCTSIAIMSENRISTAFTSDHHFEQAGFKILLK